MRNLDAPHLFDGFRVDFTGLAPNGQNLYLSKIFNKLIVELDEEGAGIAVSSSSNSTKWQSQSAIGQPAEEFNCNRPFIFIIHDRENRLPLIIGKYTQPNPII